VNLLGAFRYPLSSNGVEVSDTAFTSVAYVQHQGAKSSACWIRLTAVPDIVAPESAAFRLASGPRNIHKGGEAEKRERDTHTESERQKQQREGGSCFFGCAGFAQ